jgi:hypothetical protein
MLLIIAFINKFKNITLIPFLEFFGQEHKFETWFKKFLENVFLKVILKSFYFKFFIRQLIK